MTGVLFVISSALVAHVLTSHFGFSPTDEGFILAGSRRILDGQVPHRDFISVRPVLSHVLHIPELVLGRDHCLLLSRFVFWLEMAAISWVWVAMLKVPNAVPSAVIALALSAQLFPAMAWHTVDALLLASVGIFLAPAPFGYLLLGLAPLCRLNFVFLLPLAFVATRDAASALTLLPAAVYAAAVALLGGWNDLVAQLAAYGGRKAVATGIRGYLNRWTAAGAVIGGGLVLGHVRIWPLALALFALPLALRGHVIAGSFVGFGAAAGAVAATRDVALGFPVAVAWVSSLSIGYPWPALLFGPLALMGLPATPTAVLAWAAAAATAALVVVARWRFPYRDLPAWTTRAPLGDALPGGKGICCREAVRSLFADLDEVRREISASGARYAIVPDLSAHWIRSAQQNPLPSDWPQDVELATSDLLDRCTRALASAAPIDVLIQRWSYRDPAGELTAVAPMQSVVTEVRRRGEMIGISGYFERWRVPGPSASCRQLDPEGLVNVQPKGEAEL